MEPTQQSADRDEGAPGTQESSGEEPSGLLFRARSLSLRARIIAGVSIFAVLVLLVTALDMVASSPAVCASCHEMKPWVASWRVSAHAQVACYSCHGTPRPWYGAPLSVAERWVGLGRDLGAHWAGRSREVTAGSVGAAAVVPDATCVKCHDPARVGTSRFGVQIKHADHAARNKSCVSCHRFTAHPAATRTSRDTLMMQQCFACHSLAKGAKVSGECTVCHLKGLDLRPSSHKTGDWLTRHGPIAKSDRKPCGLCHREDFCVGCHKLAMPHPQQWAREPSLHAAVARADASVCTRCHKAGNDLCAKCHRKGYDHHRTFDPTKGPWVAQHSAKATGSGSPICYRCHEAAYCAGCHGTGSDRARGSLQR